MLNVFDLRNFFAKSPILTLKKKEGEAVLAAHGKKDSDNDTGCLMFVEAVKLMASCWPKQVLDQYGLGVSTQQADSPQ